jgi:hypothetical protein
MVGEVAAAPEIAPMAATVPGQTEVPGEIQTEEMEVTVLLITTPEVSEIHMAVAVVAQAMNVGHLVALEPMDW